MEQERLRLAEFRVLYRHWSVGLPWFDHLLLGLLVWIEDRLIDNRVKIDVDEAIEEYKSLQPDGIVSPVYTETPGDNALSVSEMRLTAPWYIESSKKE